MKPVTGFRDPICPVTGNIQILLVASALMASTCANKPHPTPGGVITNSLGMRLVYVPPGQFTMGSPRDTAMADDDEMPPHRVRITRGFYLGQNEVTQGQFARFAEDAVWETQAEREGWSYAWKNGSFQIVSGACFFRVGFPQADDHPVVCVSWDDAVEFCRWLGHREGRRYRLPSEAEWEYACRAGGQTAYQWGDAPGDGAGWCNVADPTAKEEFSKVASPSVLFPWSDGYTFTAPVGRFRPNAFGLYDMHGNVLEFCSDWYGQDYYEVGPKIDPAGPVRGEFRVLRGGDWSSYPKGCRAAKRYRDRPSIRCSNLGFRVVLDLD
jgi:formylglycine-generating enzyme required for sulfatase activity